MNQLLNDQKTLPLTSVSGDTTKVVKQLRRTEEALREVGYQSPVTRNVSAQEWDELQASIDEARKITPPVCHDCDGPLLPNQPEGAYCRRCAEELACLAMIDEDQESYTLTVFALGVLTGVVLVLAGFFLLPFARVL